ncbi:MAG: D-2-hydroxyacid dehydrogenase [Rhodospirillales bacterium]
MKIVYSLAWEIDPFEPIKETFPGVEWVRASALDGFGDVLGDADGLIVSATQYNAKVADEIKQKAKKLRWMQSAAIGIDNFVKFGIPDGVTLTNAAGLKGGTVSEHTFALLMALSRATVHMERFRAAGEWQNDLVRTLITPLEGRTMVIVGYGSIGQQLGRKAKAFDMNVIAVSRSGTSDENADKAVTVDKLLDVLPEADVVAVVLPSNPDSHHLIDAKAFAAMKKGAIFVNTGRGATMDEKALVAALQSGHLGGAGLDVFEVEPLSADSPLWTMDNVVLSPHIAGTSDRTYALFVDLVRGNIERFQKGEPLRHAIPAEMLKTTNAA